MSITSGDIRSKIEKVFFIVLPLISIDYFGLSRKINGKKFSSPKLMMYHTCQINISSVLLRYFKYFKKVKNSYVTKMSR